MREQTPSDVLAGERSPARETGLLPIATLVLWAGCLAVGAAGRLLQYPRPAPPASEPAAPPVELVNVAIAEDSSPPDAAAPAGPAPAAAPPAAAPPPPPPPPPPEATAVPAAPPLVALAVPVPAPAFVVPAQPAAHVAEAKPPAEPTTRTAAAPGPPTASPPAAAAGTAASPAAAGTGAAGPRPAAAAPGAVRRITFGEGEGRQPAPEYPREAILAHQQGTVVVRFSVAEDGRVVTAAVAAPCPSALLNQAAVRAVRETWQFPSGPARTYEVAIQFELKHH